MRFSNLVLATVISVILFSGCSSNVVVTDWQVYGLQGKVKSVIEKTYRLTADKKTRENVPDSVVVWNFTEAGKIREVVLLDGDNNYLGKTEFVYDEDGKLLCTADYDMDNQIVRGSRVVDYNESDLPVKSEVYELSKKEKRGQVTAYENDRLKEVAILNSAGNKLQTHAYSYNKHSQKETTVVNDPDSGFITEWNTDSIVLCSDKTGNWTKRKIKVSENEDIALVSERRIIYY